MLNWLVRYAPVTALLRPGRSVLDVGCGPHGLACADPDLRFVGVDVGFPHRVADTMLAVRSRPGPLPFADASFDDVICLDVLEHLPAGQRAPFVAELARVAAGRVIVACPSSEAQPLDDWARRLYHASGGAEPEWLSEHGECGLPTPEEIAAACAVDGFATAPLAMPNGLLSAMTVMFELNGPLPGAAAHEAKVLRDEWIALYRQACYGPSVREGYVLERVPATCAIVDGDDVDAGTLRALRCLDCRTELAVERAGELVRCTGCGRLTGRDPSGAWGLADAAPPPAERFYWAPDWHGEELARVLHGFLDAHDRPASLVLRAAPEVIDGPGALAAAQAALGDRDVPEFVDIVIVDGPLSADDEAALRDGSTVLSA